jgi:hypothetical protein
LGFICKAVGHRPDWQERIVYGDEGTCDVWCGRCDERLKFPMTALRFKKPELYELWKKLSGGQNGNQID